MAELAALKPNSGMLAAACDALGVSRATFHRRQVAAARPPVARSPRPTPARALPKPERQRVIALLREPQYVDLAPAEVYATLLDQGVYHCSIRTMYRILHEHAEVRERRQQRQHVVYQKLGLSKAGAVGAGSQSGVVLGYHQIEGTPKMDILLSLCNH